jgi:hypothetical protein
MSKYAALVYAAESIADELCCDYHLRIGNGPTGCRGARYFDSDKSAINELRKVHMEIEDWRRKIALLNIDDEAVRICRELGISTDPETYGQRIKQ